MTAGAAIRQALAFLSPVVPPGGAPTPEALSWFPAAGIAIGGTEGALWRSARRRWPPLPAAALIVGADVALTGALHLDGLADTVDGLFAHQRSKDRRSIMADPNIGTFGAAALGLAIVGRTAALSAVDASPLLLAALACGSRSVMAAAIGFLPYALEAGLVSAFASPDGRSRGRRAGLVGLGIALALGALAARRRGVLAVGSGALAAGAVLVVGQQRLGGYTGDVLGAAGTTFEVVGLLAAARC
jgi:adenosylcobinamide-GDP ribazoletransferase